MRIGLGPGLNARNTRVIHALNFTQAARASNVYTLPSWLTLTCATTGRTVQTSASSLATGLGANAARARNVGSGWGLSLESARTNLLYGSRTLTGGLWSAGASVTTTLDYAAGPDGTVAADRSNALSTGYSNGCAVTVVNGSKYSASVWLRSTAASGGYQFSTYTAVAAGAFSFGTATSTWTRIVNGITVDDTTLYFYPVDGDDESGFGGTTAAARDCVTDFAQLELGAYPTSQIVTTSGTSARAADVLSASAAVVAPGGYFDINCVVAPHYTQAEQAADHDIFFIDSNNRLFLRASDHKLVLRLGGANNSASSALTWSRDQALTIRARHRAAGQSLTVSGATSGSGTATASAAAAISLPASAYIGGNASGPQECLDLKSIAFVRP